jgi:hypothetical protein
MTLSGNNHNSRLFKQTSVNKTNSHVSPQLIKHKNKATRTGVQMWRVKTANGIPALHLLIMASPMAMQIYTNDKKPAQIRFYSKRPHTITKNEWQH